VRRKCAASAPQVRRKRVRGAQVYFQNEHFAWEVSQKRCSWLGKGALQKSSLQNVRFVSAGAPFCLQTITFPSENCKFDPGRKRRFRVEGVHISHFHVILLISFLIFFHHLKHDMLIFS